MSTATQRTRPIAPPAALKAALGKLDEAQQRLNEWKKTQASPTRRLTTLRKECKGLPERLERTERLLRRFEAKITAANGQVSEALERMHSKVQRLIQSFKATLRRLEDAQKTCDRTAAHVRHLTQVRDNAQQTVNKARKAAKRWKSDKDKTRYAAKTSMPARQQPRKKRKNRSKKENRELRRAKRERKSC